MNETQSIREPKLPVLQFLRWLAERGQLEHEVAGDPAGEFTENEEVRREAAAIMAGYD